MAGSAGDEEVGSAVAADVDGGVGFVGVVTVAAEGGVGAVEEGGLGGVALRIEAVFPVGGVALVVAFAAEGSFVEIGVVAVPGEEDCLFG